jgi:hypothetical protein
MLGKEENDVEGALSLNARVTLPFQAVSEEIQGRSNPDHRNLKEFSRNYGNYLFLVCVTLLKNRLQGFHYGH